MATPDFSSFTLLIAEDNEQNYRFFELALKPTGITLIHASNGAEAIDLCQQHQPHLVLMDAMMPQVSGFEAAKAIKTKYPALPVIMLTAYATPDSIREAVNAGCNDYMAKPITKTILYSYIQKWLIGTSAS
jgi:CheY-like chemotaxis protein